MSATCIAVNLDNRGAIFPDQCGSFRPCCGQIVVMAVLCRCQTPPPFHHVIRLALVCPPLAAFWAVFWALDNLCHVVPPKPRLRLFVDVQACCHARGMLSRAVICQGQSTCASTPAFATVSGNRTLPLSSCNAGQHIRATVPRMMQFVHRCIPQSFPFRAVIRHPLFAHDLEGVPILANSVRGEHPPL